MKIIKDKVEMMLGVYQGKMDQANEWNQHADGLRHEGSILVLETLLIYIKEEEAEELIKHAFIEEAKNEEFRDLDKWLIEGERYE